MSHTDASKWGLSLGVYHVNQCYSNGTRDSVTDNDTTAKKKKKDIIIIQDGSVS